MLTSLRSLANQYGIPFTFGGTGLLIIVGVCMQTVGQIEGHLLSTKYDGLSKPKSGFKGRRGKFNPNSAQTKEAE